MLLIRIMITWKKVRRVLESRAKLLKINRVVGEREQARDIHCEPIPDPFYHVPHPRPFPCERCEAIHLN